MVNPGAGAGKNTSEKLLVFIFHGNLLGGWAPKKTWFQLVQLPIYYSYFSGDIRSFSGEYLEDHPMTCFSG